MRATIKDIARETHLSPSTVSLVLNNKPHRLSEETRKRVLETAKRLDYRPNRMAASLVTNRTRTIGIVVADIKNAYFAELASGAEAKCTDMGYSLIICNTNDQREKDFDYINLMIDRGVDGIIISFSAGVEEETAQKVTAYVRKFGIRAVAIDYMTDFSHVMNVRLDNKLGGYLATKHLIDLGHRRVGCITGPINNDTCTANLRLLGYKSALRDAGIRGTADWIAYGDFHIDSGYRQAGRLVKQGVTGIFASNDLIADGVYKWAREQAVDIPERISVVGYDDIAYSDFFSPGLTTVHQPAFDMGYKAAEKIIENLMYPDKKIERTTIYEPRLVVRESTKILGQKP